MKKLIIKNVDGPWVMGTYGKLSFEAKVFDEPSHFGINDGRVSKLMVRAGNDIIYNYDRGIDIDDAIGPKIAAAIAKAHKPEGK